MHSDDIILITQIYTDSNTSRATQSHPTTATAMSGMLRLMRESCADVNGGAVHGARDLACGEVPNNETSANDDYDLRQCHASVCAPLPNTSHRSPFMNPRHLFIHPHPLVHSTTTTLFSSSPPGDRNY